MRPWLQLALATAAQAASSAAVNGPAFLIPALHTSGLSFAQAGVIAAASTAGSMCTLALWGFIADAFGDRLALTASLGLTAGFLGLSTAAIHRPAALGVALFFMGMAAAGTSAASGRVVVGSFPPQRRGTAMGVRQMAQPLGVGAAGLAVPVIADRWGAPYALLPMLITAALIAVACAVAVHSAANGAHAEATAFDNPYRVSRYLARIHAAAVLMVIPQFAVWTFMLVWLQVGRHWAPAAAGLLVAAAQALGGLGRIASGRLSDVVGSRVRPLRWVGWSAGATMLLLGASIIEGWVTAVPLMVIASVLTVADNGLAFTAVAEFAGPRWSGRALGIHNTGQYLAAAAVPPAIGAAIPVLGYGLTFGLTGFLPLLAVTLVPLHDRSHDERRVA